MAVRYTIQLKQLLLCKRLQIGACVVYLLCCSVVYDMIMESIWLMPSYVFLHTVCIQSGWGTSERGEAEENARRRTFVTTFIPSIISQLTVLTQSYQV